jgi:hypothetical protein
VRERKLDLRARWRSAYDVGEDDFNNERATTIEMSADVVSTIRAARLK